MRCQLELGQRGEGLATWQRLERVLRANLGIEPAAASRRLHSALLGK